MMCTLHAYPRPGCSHGPERYQPAHRRLHLWISGTSTALGFISWALTYDWPMNFGGKPYFALPAWIPITFELTVLFASVGMVLTFCYLCQLAPFVKKDHFHLRSTDDLFVMAIECTEKTNEGEVTRFLQDIGAKEVTTQYKETGWWLGRYDKNEVPFEKPVEVVS
jgi:hypothetical protein